MCPQSQGAQRLIQLNGAACNLHLKGDDGAPCCGNGGDRIAEGATGHSGNSGDIVDLEGVGEICTALRQRVGEGKVGESGKRHIGDGDRVANGIPTYTLKYSAKTERRWAKVRIIEE